MKSILTPAVLAVASMLVLVACGEATESGDTDSTTTATETVTSAPVTTASTSTTTAEAEGEGEGEIAAEHNNVDVMFTRMMIPHHQQAVDTSGILLTKDGLPSEVADFAQRVIDTQTTEIEQMDTMLGVWGQQPGSGRMGEMGPDDRGHMGGLGSGGMGDMMNQENMAALNNAQGSEAVRLYLEHMIPHHEGAIDMARNEVDNGHNPQAIALAEQMITAQEAEIAEMKQMLQNL